MNAQCKQAPKLKLDVKDIRQNREKFESKGKKRKH